MNELTAILSSQSVVYVNTKVTPQAVINKPKMLDWFERKDYDFHQPTTNLADLN